MKKNSSSSDLHLLVFKDNYPSRQFRVPLAWVYRLGIIAGILTLIATLSTLLAIKFAFELQQLQSNLQESKMAFTNLEAQMNQRVHSVPAPASVQTSALPSPSPPVSPARTTSPQGKIQTQAQTQTQVQTQTQQQAPTHHDHLSFKIDQPRAQLMGNELQVYFNIQYVKGDGESQQGRIIVLAHEENKTWVYPKTAENLQSEDLPYHTEKGEYFSVSRFRATKAILGPLSLQGELKEVEILIFSTDLKLLLRQRIKPTQAIANTKGGESP